MRNKYNFTYLKRHTKRDKIKKYIYTIWSQQICNEANEQSLFITRFNYWHIIENHIAIHLLVIFVARLYMMNEEEGKVEGEFQ